MSGIKGELVIRPYEPRDETGWLHCRVLSFLDSAYFDDVRTKKEQYDSPSIELIAKLDGEVAGLIDIECETEPQTVCSPVAGADPLLAGMIWHLAVHPRHRRRGIARALLEESMKRARTRGIRRLEAWTRDDAFVNEWYQRQGFRQIEKYYHIYPNVAEIRETGLVRSEVAGCRPLAAFCHYYGDDPDLLGRFSRVHECRRYDLFFD